MLSKLPISLVQLTVGNNIPKQQEIKKKKI